MTIILYGIINDISNTRLDIFFQSSKSKHMYDLITGKAYTTYFKPKGPFFSKIYCISNDLHFITN